MQRQRNPTNRQNMSERISFHYQRQQKVDSVSAQLSRNTSEYSGQDTEQLISYLVSRGLPMDQVVEGSIPVKSLEFIRHHIVENLKFDKSPIALHIGNFVGVSLAYITAILVGLDRESLVISIDPNLTHRGITNPQQYVLELLNKCGLLRNSLIIAGYSGQKSISNDGVVFENYDPEKTFEFEAACVNSLLNFQKLFYSQCDLALIDGNHDAEYLVSEITDMKPLMKSGAMLIIDDVDEAWDEIRAVFTNLSSLGVTAIASDGRVGIARFDEG